MLTQPTGYQVLTDIARRTNTRPIRLGLFENVYTFQVSDDSITLTIERVRTDQIRRGFKVSQRGFTMHGWRLINDVWQRQEPVTAWQPEELAEVHTPWVRSPEDVANSRSWADLCYRPGTDRHPLDNAARIRQGY